ncbi:MAG: trigger factor [Nitrospira sp.]|nr:trigger factor [Nitrospira sp.]
MLQEIEEITPTTRKLTINVPADVIQSESNTIYNQLQATAKIPGFRAGKVPQSILEKKFSKNVETEIIEKIIPRFYMEAVKEAKLEPVNYPNVEDRISIKPGEPLSFTVTVEVKPEIADINYEGIVLKEKKAKVEDAEIDKAITSLRENKALYSVTEDALEEEDMAIITSEAFIDGEPKDEYSHKEYPLVIGSKEMPEEFSTALKGKKKGDEVEVKIKFGEEMQVDALKGKELLCKVTVIDGKKKNLPPLDDEFAESIDDAKCKTMEELKQKMHDSLKDRKDSQINLEYKQEIINELLKRHDFDVPPSMVKGEIDSLVEQAKEDAMRRNETLKPDEELAKEFETTAKDNIRSVLILEAVGKKDNIEVNDDDVKKAMDEIASRNNLKTEELMKLYAAREGSLDAMKSRLFADKVMDFILEKSTIES